MVELNHSDIIVMKDGNFIGVAEYHEGKWQFNPYYTQDYGKFFYIDDDVNYVTAYVVPEMLSRYKFISANTLDLKFGDEDSMKLREV